MPSIHLPYINIALDAFSFIVTLIIFAACINEYLYSVVNDALIKIDALAKQQ